MSTASDLFPQIRDNTTEIANTPQQNIGVAGSRVNITNTIKSLDDFEEFLKAELRVSDLSVDIKPRSSHFEKIPNNSKLTAEEDE